MIYLRDSKTVNLNYIFTKTQKPLYITNKQSLTVHIIKCRQFPLEHLLILFDHIFPPFPDRPNCR